MSKDISDIVSAQGQALASYGGFALGLANHIVNVKQNRRNLQALERQNSLAAAESEKAYQRSLPTTQVANMRRAGMSQAGAINALNGGGSYTPAPVAAGQEQMYDFSGMQNALSNIAQVGLANAQLSEQKRQFNANLGLERDKLQFEKDKWKEEEPTRNAQLSNLGLTNDVLNIEKEVSDSLKDGRINAENAENISRQTEAILNDMRSKRVVDAMARMTEEELDNLFELQATLNMLQQGLQYDSTGAVIKAAKKLGSFVSKSGAIGRNIRTH